MPAAGFVFNIQKFSIHDGPGMRTLVFFKGCPLSCYWCSNPESRDTNPCPDARYFPLEEIIKTCLEDKDFYDESGGGVTLSGGEALAQSEFALELLRALRNEKIHSAVETSGFAPPRVFEEISGVADLLLFDIKHYDEGRHIEGTGVSLKGILANLKNALSGGRDILIRIPLIPGYNDSAKDAEGFAMPLLSFGIKRIQLLPFHQFGEKKYETLGLPYLMKGVPQLHPEDLKEWTGIMSARGIECLF